LDFLNSHEKHLYFILPIFFFPFVAYGLWGGAEWGELEQEWYGLSHTNSSQNNNSNYNNNEHLLSPC